MCGIAGWIRRHRTDDGQEILNRMTQAIWHRGPDGDGSMLTQVGRDGYEVAFGHRRLAIIDVALGIQPMSVDDGRLVISYNGEVYNYPELREELKGLGQVFETDSDTEVVLRAYDTWGTDCFGRFRGMFALAILDRHADQVIFARDPFGKKPLYFYEKDGDIAFASEVLALTEYPGFEKHLDRSSAYDYLINRYVPGPNTLFQCVRKLPPGHLAIWKNGALTQERYYVQPDRDQKPHNDLPSDPIAGYMEKLDHAVQIRMRSDVPFGAFLSGGIDSSAIVAIMSRHSQLPITTFSVGFKEDAYNELNYARAVADAYKTDHNELVISANEIMDHLPAMARNRGAPVSETADVPIYLLSCQAAKSVKMVLTGEGSDEVLAGYPKHGVEPLIGTYHRFMPSVLHNNLINPLIQSLPYKFRRVKIMMDSFSERDFEQRMQRWFGAMSDAQRNQLWQGEPSARRLDPYPFSSCPSQSALRRILFFDQASWLPDNLLERGDRMMMAGSIEGRMPFMDVDLVQYTANLPDHFRLRNRVQKWILREAMQSSLPPIILTRPKIGFRVPVNEWFQGPMRAYLCDHLTSSDSRTKELYNPAILTRYVDEHVSGRQNHEKVLWALLNLEIFSREFAIS